MSKRKIIVLIACALAAILVATAVVVTIVLVNGNKQEETQLKFETNKITLNIGQTVQLRPTFPKDYSDAGWTSRNQAVATVDGNGNVTAVAIGSAVIKLTVTVGEQTQSALCRVTVAEKGAEAVGQMIVSDRNVAISAGESYTVQAYLQFGDERVTDVTWTSSDTKICTAVNGVITGVAQGNATVNADCTYGGVKYVAEVAVIVSAKQQTLSFDLKNDYIVKDETTELNVYLVKDGKATKVDNSNVTYTVDSDVATVSGNVLTGVAPGKVTLTATTSTELGQTSASVQLDVLRYCTVEYTVEGNVVATEQVLNSKCTNTDVKKPLLDGYVFKEWTLNGKTFATDSIVDDDIVVKASWYKVTTGDSGEYVVATILRKYLDNIGFVHDGSGEQVMDDGSFKVNMQKDGVYNYSVAIPSFDFARQGVTQFSLALNYSPWTVTLGGTQLVVTSANADGHSVYDFVVYATADGGAKLTNGNVTVQLTQAQANGSEGITFGFVRPAGSTYAQCVVSPMTLRAYDYNALLSDKAALLAKMTADSDKNEYFGYYVSYYDSVAVATPYEQRHMAVPEGVAHAKQLLSGKFTVVDFTNDKQGVTASKADGTTVYSVACKTGELEIDPSGANGLYTVYLPKVNYLLFKSVSFTYKTSDNYSGIGFEQGKLLANDSGILQGTITITVTDGVATAVLRDNNLGAEVSIVLSRDVANGTTQMQLLYDAALYRKLTISNFTAEM